MLSPREWGEAFHNGLSTMALWRVGVAAVGNQPRGLTTVHSTKDLVQVTELDQEHGIN